MVKFLLGFKGRINRAKMWLVYLLSCVALGLPVSIGLADWEEALIGANPKPTTLSAAAIWAAWIWGAIVFYVMIAAIVKRLHDRNKSALWLLFFYGVPGAFFAVQLLWPIAGRAFLDGNVIAIIAFAVTWLTIAWYFVELLVLKGTSGENRFGPDPIVPKRHQRGF